MQKSLVASFAGGLLALGLAATAAAAAPAASAGHMKGLSTLAPNAVEQVHRRWHRPHCRWVRRCWYNHWGVRRCHWARRCW